MFTKEQVKILKQEDNMLGVFKEVVGNKVIFLTCNMNDENVFEGTYTIEALNWGEIKGTLKCGEDYTVEKLFADFEDFMSGREKS